MQYKSEIRMFEIRNKSECSNVQMFETFSFGHLNLENLKIVSNFGFRASKLTNKYRKGQALVELSVLGSLLVMVLVTLLHYGVTLIHQQRAVIEANPKASLTALLMTPIGKDEKSIGISSPGAGTYTIIRDFYLPDTGNPFGRPMVQTVSAGDAVTWSHDLYGDPLIPLLEQNPFVVHEISGPGGEFRLLPLPGLVFQPPEELLEQLVEYGLSFKEIDSQWLNIGIGILEDMLPGLFALVYNGGDLVKTLDHQHRGYRGEKTVHEGYETGPLGILRFDSPQVRQLEREETATSHITTTTVHDPVVVSHKLKTVANSAIGIGGDFDLACTYGERGQRVTTWTTPWDSQTLNKGNW